MIKYVVKLLFFYYNMIKKFFKMLLYAIVALFVISLFFGSFQTVRTGNVWVLYTFGRANMKELQPWIHFKIPFVQNIVIMDTKARTINYHKDNSDGTMYWVWIVSKPQITVMDKRSLAIDIDLSMIYKLQASEAAETLNEFGINYDEKLINPVVRDVARSVFGSYTAETIAENRWKISRELKAEIELQFEKAPLDKFEIVAVQLRDVQLPAEIRERMLEVQKKNQEVSLAEQELAEQRIKSETIQVQAKAEAEKQIEEARWRAESRKTEAAAEAQAILLKFEAQAEWYRQLNQSISDGVIQLEKLEVQKAFADAWNGDVPKIVSEWTNTIIPADMEKLGVSIDSN